MAEKTDVQQATAYLTKRWQASYPGRTPPLELTEAVVRVVMAVGYTRKIVDRMLTSFCEKDILSSDK